jgi:hypothetical protein
VDQDAVRTYIQGALEGVDVQIAAREDGSPEVAWGDTFFFADPERKFPFATIVTKDYGDFDSASNLDRPDVFRLNIELSKDRFTSLFGAGGDHDFAALDQLMPHPVYGRAHWVCVLNPSPSTLETLKPLLAEAYDRSAKRHQRKGADR